MEARQPTEVLRADGKRKPWKDGDVVEAKDGTRYRLSNTLRDAWGKLMHGRSQYGTTFVRVNPKAVKGKANVKRAKKARRAAREAQQHTFDSSLRRALRENTVTLVEPEHPSYARIKTALAEGEDARRGATHAQ